MTTWGVWCVVYGGVTGHREGWLKSFGRRVEFDSKAEAQAEAVKLQNTVGNSNATFHYYAMPAVEK